MKNTEIKKNILNILMKKYDVFRFFRNWIEQGIYNKPREERTEEEEKIVISLGQASYFLDDLTEKANKLILMLDDSEELKEIFINLNKIEVYDKYIKTFDRDILSLYIEGAKEVLKHKKRIKEVNEPFN